MVKSTQTPKLAGDFLAILQSSRLLTKSQIERTRTSFALTADQSAEDVARRLVQERVLTPFQAERLLEGRYRGFVIDRYRVREVLGVGGMGCVFIAEDPRLNAKVALKVLSSQHATDAGMLARLKLEGWAGMKIDHPNVVRTHRVDSTGAVNFLVMDLIRGISLHELVALGGPLKPPLACHIFQQAALGLQAAHDLNIIHRDVKPANLLIDPSGHTRVLDFGLALVGDKEAAEFSLAMIFGHDCLGTPDYLAPEQVKDSNAVDPRADIYGLGCTLYVALTGRVPFSNKQTNREKLIAQQTETPPSILKIRPSIPANVAAVVEKMMAKNPADRYATAAEAAAALEVLAKKGSVKFDFRKLITIRAKQARERELMENRRREASRSFITSTFSWVDQPSHHLAAEVDTFTADETPAVRQPDARRPGRPDIVQGPAERTINAPRNRSNVPAGWSILSLGSGRRLPLTTLRIRIGRSSECEVRPRSETCDERQCSLEFDGTRWNLKQESRNQPTYVDGELTPYAALKSGSTITFSDGSGYKLVWIASARKRRQTRRQWAIIAGMVISFLAAAIAAWYFLPVG